MFLLVPHERVQKLRIIKMTIKAVILIGGPNKGQRFRPLSFDSPKYMFPVGGETIIGHLIESCLKIEQLSEIILLGFYQQDEMLSQANLLQLVQKFTRLNNQENTGKVPSVRYLQEFTRMGTAGGLYHFRDQIRHGNPEAFLVINGDVCGDFDFNKMLGQHRESIRKATNGQLGLNRPYITIMTTEAGRQESQNYGCIVEDPESHVINHYAEKPSTFVSNLINCGAYVCSLELLVLLESAMRSRRDGLCDSINPSSTLGPHCSTPASQLNSHPDYLSLELNILQDESSLPHCYSYRTQGSWWCQVKTAASAIYANGQYLKQFNKSNRTQKQSMNGEEERRKNCTIIGDVYIHPTAIVDPTAVIGPNASIMAHCVIGPGVRVKESIILQNATITAHSLVLCSIVGWNCSVGPWARVEGTPSEPDPNQKFAKVQNPPLFNPDGKLNPSISVLCCNVKIPGGTVILNSIVLPHKELARSYKNEIVL